MTQHEQLASSKSLDATEVHMRTLKRVLTQQTDAVRQWGEQAKKLIETRQQKSHIMDQTQVDEIRQLMHGLDSQRLVRQLQADACAAIINPGERARMKKFQRANIAQTERALLTKVAKERAEIAEDLFKRRTQTRAMLHASFVEGPALVSRFGALLAQAGRSVLQFRCEQLQRAMEDDGRDVGVVAADTHTHANLTLDALAMAPLLELSSDHLTVRRRADAALLMNMKPGEAEPWSMVRTITSPWRLRRSDKPLLKQLVAQGIAAVPSLTSLNAIRTVARILDAIHPSHGLHAQVLSSPDNARTLVDNRLAALGYHIQGGTLDACKTERSVRQVCKELLQLMDQRLESFSRCYLEMYPAANTDWVAGWVPSNVVSAEFPGAEEATFGFSADGYVHYAGHKLRYTQSLRDVQVIGLLCDLKEGTLTLYADGVSRGIGFGKGANHIPEQLQSRQSRIILAETLIPAFALRTYVQKSVQQSPQATPEDAYAALADQIVNVSSVRSTNSELAMSFAASRADNDSDEESAPDRAQLRVSFGTEPFVHPTPTDAHPCDVYVSFLNQEAATLVSMNVSLAAVPDDEVTKAMEEHEAFVKALQLEEARSWSRYPPNNHKLWRAAMILQKAIRKWIVRSRKENQWVEHQGASRVIQRWFRKRMPDVHLSRLRSALKIQAIFRGVRVRLIYRLSRKYGLDPTRFLAIILRLQRRFRERRQRMRAKAVSEALKAQFELVHKTVRMIQRAFRMHRFRRMLRDHIKQRNAAIALQAAYRGHAQRRKMLDRKRRPLLDMMDRLKRRYKEWHAALQIQRVWRGHRDRVYAAKRRRIRERAAIVIQAAFRGYLTLCKLEMDLDEIDFSALRDTGKRLRAAHGLWIRFIPRNEAKVGRSVAISHS
eukprot:TRINITY_DN4835_c0_g2_i1.p1 TRINITY_DN4835_c0_g2~~TRINITY_DN4835_c0_g2_i1.p1  ORF type:complete len:888 (+),score=194.87 TRINITY_DN4835_c0_g2_i1:81-2744(+)